MKKALLLILLSGCSVSASVGNPQAVDNSARAELQQIKQILQALGGEIQKEIVKQVNEANKKK